MQLECIEKLIQSYVMQTYFISTIYRQSSVCMQNAPWYYETIVFEWDKNTKQCGKILEQEDSGITALGALINHNNLCEKYAKLYLQTI